MLDRHQPDEQFVDKLEWQIAGEVRRRNRAAAAAHPMWRLARVAAVVVVSMSLGAAAMGASYQAEDSWRRELLEADLEVRLELARRRAELVAEEAAAVERRAEIGAAGPQERAQMRMFLAETEGSIRLLELQLEEIRASGREPVGEVSSPVVRGRDFVSERLAVELELARQMLDLVQEELQREQTRRRIGVIDQRQLEAVELAVAEREGRVRSIEARMGVRADFVAGEIGGVEAELRVRVAGTEAEREVARQRFELMQRELNQVRERVRIGTEPPIAASQFELAVAEAEAELRLAEVELEVLRSELVRQRQQR